jgi:hypothetical protein
MWTRTDQEAADDEQAAAEGCLRGGGEVACFGAVTFRLSTLGTRIPECAKHMRISWDREAEISERYPAQAPADFDPAYAGEVWDED